MRFREALRKTILGVLNPRDPECVGGVHCPDVASLSYPPAIHGTDKHDETVREKVLSECLSIFNPLVGDYYTGARLVTERVVAADISIGLRAFYYPVFRRLRFDEIAIRVEGAGGAGAALRLGVYGDNGSRYPANLILDAGTVDATAPAYRTISINLTLDAGNYYLAALNNDATIDMTTYTQMFPLRGGSATSCIDYPYSGYRIAGYAWGPLPDPFPAGGLRMTQIFCMGLRVAEVF